MCFKKSLCVFFFTFLFTSGFAQKGNASFVPEIIPQRLDIYDTVWNEIIHDPYRWMENLENDSLKEWITQENKKTINFVSGKIKKIYKEIDDFGRLNYHPYIKEGKYYFVYIFENTSENLSLYYTKNYNTLPELLINPSKIDKNKKYDIKSFHISEDDSKLAVQLDADGMDWRTIRVFDIHSKKWLADEINNVKYSNIEWYGNGFFYVSYNTEDRKDALRGIIRGRTLYYHELGTEQSKDRLIFTDNSDDVFNFGISRKGTYLILYQERISGKKSFKQFSQTKLPLEEDVEFKSFFLTDNPAFNSSLVGENENGLIIHSNFQSPNGALYVFEPQKLNQATLLIQPTDAVIQGAWQCGEKIIIQYLYNNENYLTSNDLNGQHENVLILDKGRYLNSISGSSRDSMIIISTSSFYDAPNFFHLNVQSFAFEQKSSAIVNFNPNLFVTKKVQYTSNDGTLIPMFITHRKDLKLDGKNPTLLYGYGGFGRPTEPFFNPMFIAFMQYGGILAVPQIRGGGDFPGWHEQGKRQNKQNTTDDFVAAAEYLNTNYTSSEKLAIMGGSQGGLLVLTAMTQRPELFKAVVSNAGLSDMTRYHLYNIGYSYKDEYGDARDSLDFSYLIAYSPLHKLKKNMSYPATLLTSGINDDRVHPFHTLKMQATLQDKSISGNPHLILIRDNDGHCSCGTYDDRVDLSSNILSFIFKMLDMEKNLKKYWVK